MSWTLTSEVPKLWEKNVYTLNHHICCLGTMDWAFWDTVWSTMFVHTHVCVHSQVYTHGYTHVGTYTWIHTHKYITTWCKIIQKGWKPWSSLTVPLCEWIKWDFEEWDDFLVFSLLTSICKGSGDTAYKNVCKTWVGISSENHRTNGQQAREGMQHR